MKYIVFLWLIWIQIAIGGHELLYKWKNFKWDIKAEEIAIIQYDNRPLDSFWNHSAVWNKAYCEIYGHSYMYFTSNEKCSYASIPLAEPWCKVKAMLYAHDNYPSIKVFLYLDSDAVMTVNYSLSSIVPFMIDYHHWDMRAMPIAFNQDGPGWSCKNALKNGASKCFNSGSVLWFRNDKARDILSSWWNSAGEPYDLSLFPSKWRDKWPWEQAQMYTIHHRNNQSIMVLSFPSLQYLPWTSKKNPKSQYPTDSIEPWCFSHWPGANCFITHHCASYNQKLKIMYLYPLPNNVVVTPIMMTKMDV